MNTTTCRWFSALALLLFAGLALAQEQKRVGLGSFGNLVLNVPPEWRISDEPGTGSPPSIVVRLRPATGDAFGVHAIVVRLDPARAFTPEQIRERLQAGAKRWLSKSVEREIPLTELRGGQVIGYHFTITEREARPNDYKYLTQAAALVGGEVFVVFTVGYREADSPAKEIALRMLADAVHAKDEPSVAAGARPDALQITESGENYLLDVPIGRLVMALPKAGMTRMPSFASPASNHPRYFYFTAGTLNLSGWFEPAQRFKGIQEFWESETANWKRQGLPEMQDIAFGASGNWQVVTYEQPAPAQFQNAGFVNTHARAHWVQAGTWIDLHISVTSKGPATDNRARILSFLQTIRVTEKDK